MVSCISLLQTGHLPWSLLAQSWQEMRWWQGMNSTSICISKQILHIKECDCLVIMRCFSSSSFFNFVSKSSWYSIFFLSSEVVLCSWILNSTSLSDVSFNILKCIFSSFCFLFNFPFNFTIVNSWFLNPKMITAY